MNSFFAMIIGKIIKKESGLQEGVMDDTKPWYKSKTIISGIASGLMGIYLSLIAGGVHLPPVPPWIITLLSGIGIYGRFSADTKISS